MATTAATITKPSASPLAQAIAFVQSSDVQLALGLIVIVFLMFIPVPPFLLDFLLAISITLAFLILLISIYVKEPLEFSTFPTVLLVTTLFRLALNVATTRSILLNGSSGHVSAIVKAFGEFSVGGNYFVGTVVFIILVVINFMVITKGAGRIAEVGARFTLDAMPGKQMSIDAEMNNGLIDRDEAKRRRSKIEREADFYGAMDGASKFVRGDAIAGIIITAINIIVGLIIGVLQHSMTFASAAKTYTLLTIGDGLVSQVPALIISTAAGMVVARASGANGLSEDLSDQVTAHPKAMYVCSGLLLMLGLVPGLPFVPFSMMSVLFFFLGRYSTTHSAARAASKVAAAKESKDKAPAVDSIEALLHVDVLALEVGVSLIPLVDTHQDGEILERIVSSRKQFAQEMGIVVPIVMVRDNIQLKPGEYQVLLKSNSVAKGNLMVDYYLAMDAGDTFESLNGIKTSEPAYGLPAIWIKPNQKDEASFKGYTVVNCATVVVTHLTKVIQDHCAELIGRQEVQHLVDGIKQDHPKVIEEVIAADRLNLGDVVKILQNLLSEGVSIRDLLTIFETIADHCRSVKHPDALTRYVRKALGRGIIKKYLGPDNILTVVTLDRVVEDLCIAGIQHREDGSTSLQLDPEIAQKILQSIATNVEKFQASGAHPVILCGSQVRWELRSLVNRFLPGVVVIAFDEISGVTQTKAIGMVSI